MDIKTVIKRDGSVADFDVCKIRDAVNKACRAINEPDMGSYVCEELLDDLSDRMNVEQIQDLVENALMKKNPNVARAYIKYRYNREQLRTIKPIDLVDKYLDESDWRVKENASVGYSLGGMILNNSGAVTANYWLNKIYPKEIGDAHRDCKFHIHDLSMLACYCVGHNLLDLIKKGIGGVPGKITSAPPKHLSTLVNQMVNYLGLLQNENAGAQAFSSFDTYLAPYVKYENLSRKEVYQCLQSFMYGVNTCSRWGCVPLSTKVLTQEGWKQYSDVRIGEVVYTVNPKTRNVEFNSVKKLTRKYNDREYLIRLYNKEYNYEQIVSWEHRVYTSDKTFHRAYEFLDESAQYKVPLTVREGFGLAAGFESAEPVDISVSVERIPYDGEVWCPTTDNGVVFFLDANGHTFISGNSQPPFSNITLDWNVPQDLAETRCWIGDKQVDFKYKDCQAEMDMLNEVLIDLYQHGDVNGRGFAYPIPTYSITKDFDWEAPNAQKLFKLTSQYGVPYFQNFINSDLNPSDVRSMCITPDTIIKIKGPEGEEECTIQEVFDAYDDTEFQVLTRWGYYPVKRKIIIPYNGKLYRFTTKSGKTLTTTPDHPHLIYINDSNACKKLKIVPAKDLKVGDRFSVRYEKNALHLYNESKKGKTYEEFYGEEKAKNFKAKLSQDRIKRGVWMGDNNPMRNLTAEENALRIQRISEAEKGHAVSEKCRRLSSERWLRNNPIHSQSYWDHVQSTNGHSTISSKWEYVLRDELDALGLDYKHQYVITDKNGDFTGIADFYIPSKNLIIELETDFSHDEHCYYNEEVNNAPYVKKPWNELIRSMGYNLLVYDPSHNDGSYRGYINYKDEIISIDLVDYQGLVYDLEVDTPADYCFSESLAHSFYANNILTHNCCRLRLDKRELMKRGGGLFGAAERTGSTGVVTINLPQLGYLYKGDKDGLYKELDRLLVLAKDSLVIKRNTIEKLLEGHFYPYSSVYVENYDTFFNTIGINGCNECIRNFTNDEHNIADEWGQAFTNELMDYLNKRLADFQEETGLLFNLEAAPSEGTSYRLALHDKQNYPDIITAGREDGNPYYTNSTWLPANYTDDIFDALDIQDQFQTKYTGGTVFHAYIGERIQNWKACAELIKNIFTNYRLPYLTISPTYSVCPIHGYLDGEQKFCPRCRDEELAKIDQEINTIEKELEEMEK